VPSRRTFAPGIVPAAHSEETSLPPSALRSVSYAGSIGTGSPSRRMNGIVPGLVPRRRSGAAAAARGTVNGEAGHRRLHTEL